MKFRIRRPKGDLSYKAGASPYQAADLTGANLYKSPNKDRVVYGFGGRLGLAYQYQSSIKFEAGYRVANYHGTFDIISGFVDPVQRIGNLNTSNFGYSGPYIELTWHM